MIVHRHPVAVLATIGLAALGALGARTARAGTVPPPPSTARLQGQFQLIGRVSIAVHVRGERRGQIVQRIWTFTPMCPAGPCALVQLVRPRAAGTDTIVLQERAPALYVGTGVFYAPLRCAGRTYPAGVRVPFTITVAVTQSLIINGLTVASGLNAVYSNRSRTNMTPCVAGSLGHDGATYGGHLIL